MGDMLGSLVPKAGRALLDVKNVDVLAGGLAFNNTTSVTTLNALSTGANSYNRIGRKINLRSLQIRGYIYQNQAGAAPAPDVLRWALVYDKQTDGTAPTWAQVFTSIDKGAATDTSTMAFRNLDNADRFIVLAEEFYKVDCPAGAIANNQPAHVASEANAKWFYSRFIKLKNIPTQFTAASTGTVSDIQTGGLFFMTASDLSAANAQYATKFTTRIRYCDV